MSTSKPDMAHAHDMPGLTTDAAALARELEAEVDAEIRFDAGSRALYSTDASNYRQVPIGVIVPRSTEALVEALAICRKHGAPVLGRGCGTSLAGQCTNVAVVFDCSKYLHRVLAVDPEAKRARVQPGTILDHLRRPLEQQHRLTFAPDPATHDHCTIGGMIGNNSCGVHSVMGGRTADNVEELEIVTYDGVRMRVGPTSDEEFARIVQAGGRRAEIYSALRDLRDEYAPLVRSRYPDIPRRVSGFALDELLPERGFHVARALVGTESTCVMILESTLRLVDWPPHRALVVLGCVDVYTAGDLAPRVMEHGPVGLEGIDDRLVDFMKTKDLHPKDVRLLPDGEAWLLAEFGGEEAAEATERAQRMLHALQDAPGLVSTKLLDDPEEAARVWEIRESGLGATAFVPAMRDAWPGWEDAAVPPSRVGDYLRDFRRLLDEFGYDCALYGHFGQGCIHCRITFDLVTHEGISRYRDFIERAAELVVDYGGSLSGEHGDGQARGALLERMYGPELVEAFRRFKRIWDPEGRMNPGKVVEASAPTQHLRLGTDYRPDRVETYFAYPDDGGSFAHATLRCVGVGKCRRTHDAFMCPSFVATRDERDTTRGRARALFEMLEGDVITGGLGDDLVHEALDLCLGCKGCKSECPVEVDMATYKAELLAHRYRHRLRPRSHYAMGLIDRWLRVASLAPSVANFFAQRAPFSRMAKLAAGVAHERHLPRLARRTFTSSFEHTQPTTNSPPVVLLPDVFHDHFFPEALHAAVTVLRHFGHDVRLPPARLPGLRPRVHYGMLRSTKIMLQRTIRSLAPFVRSGSPLVGIEPSTVSIFREEALNLFPHDIDAQRIAQRCLLLSEFLDQQDADLPHVGGTVLYHGHCHQKAVLDANGARRVLERMGVDRIEPQTGCCGMAGSFGYEAGTHHTVSLQIAEEHLLPAIRAAEPGVRVVVEGFSCREQILHGTSREPEHLALFVASALENGRSRSEDSIGTGATT